jgi:hypothetical protein
MNAPSLLARDIRFNFFGRHAHWIAYFVTIRRGGAVGVGAGGEIVNVTQVFQPWGRFSAANSL